MVRREVYPKLSREADVVAVAEKHRAAEILNDRLGRSGEQELRFLASGAMGGRDSAHDVFFVTSASPGFPGETFAVKRFRREESAAREHKAIKQAAKRGFNTLQPVGAGVYEMEEMGYALVTARLPHFTTMNQVGWQNFFAGQQEYESVAHTLQSISKFVGSMHRAGIVHRDLQLKNIGQVPPHKFVLFDLEGARFFSPNEKGEEFEFQGAHVDDLKDMVTSLVHHGYLSSATPELFRRELTTNVFDPYSEVYPSETVLEQWEGIMDHALFEREHDRSKAAVAAGNLALTAR